MGFEQWQKKNSGFDAWQRENVAVAEPPAFDPEGSGYDDVSATQYGLTADETGHFPSRVPQTGLLLKGRSHKTWPLTVKGEEEAGYEISKGPDGRYYSQQKQRKWWEGGSASDPAVLRTSEFIPGAAKQLLAADVNKWTGPDWKSSIPDEKDWYYTKKEHAANVARFEQGQFRRKKLTGGVGRPFTAGHGDIHGVEGYIRSGAKPIGAKENLMRGDLLAKLPFSTVKAAEMLNVWGSIKRLESEDFSRYTEAGIDAEKGKLRDQRVVDEYFKALQEQSVRGKTFMADVGSGVSDLPAWMIEFWVTGGMAKLASKGVATAGLKFMGKYVKTQAGRHALANVLRVGAATVITPTIRTLQQPHRVVEGAVGNMIQGDQPITAWLKAGVSQNIENWSEAMGGYITKGMRTSFATKDVMRVFDDFAKARYIARGGTAEAFGKAIKAGGYDGLIGELGEEWLGGMSQALLGTETFGAEQTGDFLKDTQARLDAAAIALLKQTPSMAATLAVPGAIKGGLDIVGGQRRGPPAEPEPTKPPTPAPTQAPAAEPPTAPVVAPPKVTKAQEGVQEAEITTVFHGSDKIIKGKIKPSKSGVLFVSEDEAKAKDYGKNITEFQIPTSKILKIEPNEKGQFRDDKFKSLEDAEKQGFLAIERAGEILTRPEVLQPPTEAKAAEFEDPTSEVALMKTIDVMKELGQQFTPQQIDAGLQEWIKTPEGSAEASLGVKGIAQDATRAEVFARLLLSKTPKAVAAMEKSLIQPPTEAKPEAVIGKLKDQGKLGFLEEDLFVETTKKELTGIVSEVKKNEGEQAANLTKALLNKGIQTESSHVTKEDEIVIRVSNLSDENKVILQETENIEVKQFPRIQGDYIFFKQPAQPPTEAELKEAVSEKPAAKVGKAKAIALAAETGKKTLYEKETPPEVQEFLRRKHNLAPLTVTKDTKDAANVMDGYFAEGDDQIAQAKVEGIRLQKRVKEATKSRKFGPKQIQADMAMQVYIDLKNNPEQVKKYYSKLTDKQKALVDLAQNLPAELKAIADDIVKLNKEIGLNALDRGVIGNVIENYSMRLWEGKTQKDRPLFRKFGTKTARAKHRTLEGILHGWSLGKKLKIKGATNAHAVMRTQVATTLVDRQLLKTAKQWGLISNQQHEDWVKIEHPNFTDWRWAGKADDAKTYGRNFFVTDDGNLMERVPMYAEPVLGKHLNNALGTSKLYSIPGVKTVTEWNAILKRWILFTSFFHHQAYIRSYMLGGKTGLRNLSAAQAYKAGKGAIENYTPDFQRGVRNGLTVGLMQDFDEVSRSKISVFGRMLNHVPVAGHLAKGINWLRMKNEDWLFGKLGPYLKVQAYLLEYAAGVKKNKKALEAGVITLDDIAATAAKLANDDFGGLHLRRMGRNPTLQHIFRLLALAPDWTESNVRSAVKAFKLNGEGRVYRAFWARIAAKGLLAIIFFNFLMSLFDDEKDFLERYREAWKNGKMRWMDIDITPLYRAMGGKADKRKYFSLFGHFKDPVKFIARDKFKEPALKDVPDPVRSLLKSAKYKGSVITRIFADGITGKDWKGSEFTTILELLGTDDKGVYVTSRKGKYEKGDPKGGKLKGKLTKWSMGGVRPLGLEQVPSFLVYELRQTSPIQVQNGISYLLGQMDGFDAILKGAGAYISSTYDPAEKYQGKSVSELKAIRKDYVYARTSRKLGHVKGKPHAGKEQMVESLDRMIKDER